MESSERPLFPKADVKEHPFRLSLYVCFRPADIEIASETPLANVCFWESGHSLPSVLLDQRLKTRIVADRIETRVL